MTKTIPLILTLFISSLYADYNMAFAKATKVISLDSSSATINYVMGDKLKKYFEKNLPENLKKHSIGVGSGKVITVMPVQIGTYEYITNNKMKLLNEVPISQVNSAQTEHNSKHDDNSSSGAISGIVGNFTTGFTTIGSQGNAGTFASGIANSTVSGLATLGFGFVLNGINALGTMSDQYLMVSDVYFGSERTRIMAFVYSMNINEETAMEKLSDLTSQKIAELAAGKRVKNGN
jgi:hypothetical protein